MCLTILFLFCFFFFVIIFAIRYFFNSRFMLGNGTGAGDSGKVLIFAEKSAFALGMKFVLR